AYVRRPSGQAVPDGTQVLFTTTLGTIKDLSVVQTVNGVARTVLQTGTVAGTAKITASALSVGAITTTEIEFLSDRSLLSSANEYVEITAPGYMMFSLDQRILGAAGVNHGAKLRYREIEIDADDLQFNIAAYEVRAKRAHLKMGKLNQDFDDLDLKLTARKGVGTTTLIPDCPVTATAFGLTPWFEATHPRLGLASIHSSGVEPMTDPFDASQFRFEDLSDSTSLVSAKKAVVFPQKKIQFQKATLIVGGVKMLKMPMYEVSLNSGTNIVTDQIIGIQNNQLSVDYPIYLTLKPGETSLFRLTTGTQYGRTSGVDHGISLDYELNWNKGDGFDGGLALTSMTSRNWDLNVHQYVRFDERTSATVFVDVPEGQSLYGNLNFNKQFEGWGMNLSSSASHNLRGNRFDNNQLSFVAEKDPIKMGRLPLRFTYGVNASVNDTHTSLQSQSQNLAGIHFRTQLVPVKLDGFSQLNGYFTVTEQEGHNSINGLAYQANATLSHQFGRDAQVLIAYDYLENGFNSGLTGRHQLSFSGGYHRGNFDSTLSGVKALDVDKVSLFADTGYRLSNLWRLSYAYTLDRYLGNTFVDYTAAIGYRIGIREIGITFSGRTKHFGLQILGTSFGN
ncbi:MAG TPA: Ig-like domain-containing protein, partial [Fimbriimonadaceae bacterium]|nr:Ig-like domain-containing protein [Fimbriimonadaceae bacterium]